nr:MAG TPA: PNMA protein [Caudoviricetes sp.]
MALLDDICRFLNLPRHAVKVAGILFKAGDPQPHPFRMRPLR